MKLPLKSTYDRHVTSSSPAVTDTGQRFCPREAPTTIGFCPAESGLSRIEGSLSSATTVIYCRTLQPARFQNFLTTAYPTSANMVGQGQCAFELHYDFRNLTTNKVDPQKKEGAVNTDSTPPQNEVSMTCPAGHVEISFPGYRQWKSRTPQPQPFKCEDCNVEVENFSAFWTDVRSRE